MRIAQIIDSLKWGGAQKLLVTFAEEAASRDIDKLIVISLREHKTGVVFADQLKAVGVDVYFLPAGKLLSFSRIRAIMALLKQNKIDIVHTHLLYANIVGGLAAWLCWIPAVASIHNVQEDPMRANAMRHLLETWILKYFNHGVIAVGQRVAELEKQRFKADHIRVIPNAVEIFPTLSDDVRQRVRNEFLDDPNDILMISVGRLNAQKAFGDMITAVFQIVDSFPNFRLIIAGIGKRREALQEKINSLQLEKHIQLLGGRNDVPDLLSACDLFVSSSHWEGLPIAVLEGMSAGLPIIGTRVGDMPYVVAEGETGLLVEPGDISGLGESLRSLLKDEDRRKKMGVAGRERIKAIYSAQIWVDNLLAYYKECMSHA